MLVVALTGGIGSGKSAVAERLAAHGVPVLDADQLARDLVAPGQEALAEIVRLFGPAMLDRHGGLDRTALRRHVFADATARQRLEKLLHPRIRSAMLAWLQGLQAPYAVLVVPLLLETGQTDLAHRVLVVDLPETLQIERATQRDGQSAEQIRAILHALCPRAERRAAADDLIDNSGDLDALQAQTDALHQRYMSLARDTKNLREIPALRPLGKY